MKIKKFYGMTALALSAAMIISACGVNDTPEATTASETVASEVTKESTTEAAEESTTETSDDADKSTEAAEYASKLFDDSYVHTINIEISDEDWADLLENPTDKTKYQVNVTIDGEEVDDVSFATKGNSSLSTVASNDDSDRYSFKINFGKYVDDQTYYGLDKLNLNNIFSDATYLKDYLCYHMFNEMDVDAPLTSFINVTINGESWGLYLAVEDVGDAFLERTGNTEGELYKPETADMDNVGGGPGKGGMQAPEGDDAQSEAETSDDKNVSDKETAKSEKTKKAKNTKVDSSDTAVTENVASTDNAETQNGFSEAHRGGNGALGATDGNGGPSGNGAPGGNGGPGGFGGNDSGASLKYTDDELDSYSDIFDNAETDVTEDDQTRLIAALKALSEGNVEDSIDIDSVIDYFVVHNFVMNYDSYTGNMLHNYYLYEEDGKLKFIPWDYNLSFGSFMNQSMGGKNSGEKDATYIVNYGIDSPLSGANEEDRPMWAWITSNDEYLQKYHDRFEALVEYVTSDTFNDELDRLYEMLLPYVEEDATAFYTADEFKTAFDTVKEFISLRAESIKKQLSGELSTITDEQEESARVDASAINIDDMGSQGGPGNGGPQGDGQGAPQNDASQDAGQATPQDIEGGKGAPQNGDQGGPGKGGKGSPQN